jgi:hypothetical protein
MTRPTIWVVCAGLLSMAAGCATPEVRNTYDGPERAAAEVAILFTPKKDAYADKRPRALFSAVDGKHYGTDTAGYPAATRVLPGDVLVRSTAPWTTPIRDGIRFCSSTLR